MPRAHAFVLLSLAALTAAQFLPFEEYMLTLGGTGQKGVQTGAEDQELSYGNVLPETLLPWAMNGWAPVTDISAGSWWFSAFDHHFYGIRCTHQPSPCEDAEAGGRGGADATNSFPRP